MGVCSHDGQSFIKLDVDGIGIRGAVDVVNIGQRDQSNNKEPTQDKLSGDTIYPKIDSFGSNSFFIALLFATEGFEIDLVIFV
jgi:hypothetical protein